MLLLRLLGEFTHLPSGGRLDLPLLSPAGRLAFLVARLPCL